MHVYLQFEVARRIYYVVMYSKITQFHQLCIRPRPRYFYVHKAKGNNHPLCVLIGQMSFLVACEVQRFFF